MLSLARRYPIVGTVISAAANRDLLPVPSRVVHARYRDGREMLLALGDRTQRQMLLGRYEPLETDIIKRLLRPGDTYIDVGAHVGWFVVQAGRLVRPNGRVFAFEAFPENADTLRRNVALNRLDNVVIENCAVADGSGSVAVGRQRGSDSGSVTAGVRAAEALTEVRQIKLDDYLPPDVSPKLIKIDVEGLEQCVLDGASGTLKRTDAVLVECNESALRANSSSPAQLVAELRAAGLTNHWVLATTGSRFRRKPSIPNLLATRSIADELSAREAVE